MTGVLCTVYGAQVYFFLHWEMTGHWSRVNLVKYEALLKDLHAIININAN